MKAAKVDHNQRAVVAALRGVGASVVHLHAVGRGCPDIAVGFRGRNWFFEIKDGAKPPSDRKLTPAQVEWHRSWRGQVSVILNADDALRVIGVESYRDLHSRIVGNEASRKGCIPSGSDQNPEHGETGMALGEHTTRKTGGQ